MDESRFRVASVHHVYTRWVDEQVNGHICLCGAVMLTHRECTEHIVDAYRADFRAQVALHEQRARMLITNAGTGPLWLATADAYADVLGLIDGSDA